MLDESILSRVEGVFCVRDDVDKVYEVAMLTVLRVRGSRMTGGEESMMRVEWREDNRNIVVVQGRQMERVAHVMELEPSKVW